MPHIKLVNISLNSSRGTCGANIDINVVGTFIQIFGNNQRFYMGLYLTPMVNMVHKKHNQHGDQKGLSLLNNTKVINKYIKFYICLPFSILILYYVYDPSTPPPPQKKKITIMEFSTANHGIFNSPKRLDGLVGASMTNFSYWCPRTSSYFNLMVWFISLEEITFQAKIQLL